MIRKFNANLLLQFQQRISSINRKWSVATAPDFIVCRMQPITYSASHRLHEARLRLVHPEQPTPPCRSLTPIVCSQMQIQKKKNSRSPPKAVEILLQSAAARPTFYTAPGCACMCQICWFYTYIHSPLDKYRYTCGVILDGAEFK